MYLTSYSMIVYTFNVRETDKKIFEGVLSIFCNNLIIITACAVENPVVDETS